MHWRRRAHDGDRGETLIEVLASITILGIAGVAVLAGLLLAVKASDIHRKATTGSAYVRNYAEAIQDYVSTSGVTNYKPCAGANAYNVNAVTTALALPSGYSATHTAALSVSPTGATTSCGTDTGAQQLTLSVKSTDNRATETLVIVLRKPCDPSVAPCT